MKLLVFLLCAGLLAFCGATVPLGKKTFFGHVKAIWVSEPMNDLKDGVKPGIDSVKRGVKAGVKAGVEAAHGSGSGSDGSGSDGSDSGSGAPVHK